MADERAHKPTRFERGAELALRDGACTRVGSHQYRIVGNDEPEYFVDLSVDPPCYCGDMWFRGRKIRNNCKHTIAARICDADPALRASLTELVYATQQRRAS